MTTAPIRGNRITSELLGSLGGGGGSGGSGFIYTPRPLLSAFTLLDMPPAAVIVDGGSTGPLSVDTCVLGGVPAGWQAPKLHFPYAFGGSLVYGAGPAIPPDILYGSQPVGLDVHVIARVRSRMAMNLGAGGAGIYVSSGGNIRGLGVNGADTVVDVYNTIHAPFPGSNPWSMGTGTTEGAIYFRISFMPSIWSFQTSFSIDGIRWVPRSNVGLTDWLGIPDGFGVYFLSYFGSWVGGDLLSMECKADLTQTYEMGYGP